MSDHLIIPTSYQRTPLRISTDVPLYSWPSCDSSPSSSSSNGRSSTPSGATPITGDSQFFPTVLCIHDFESSDPVHLSFHKHERLIIIRQERSGWWAAMRPQGDRIGWIPSSFVLPLDGGKIVEYSGEMVQRPYGRLNDFPLSAVRDPWVCVPEDYKAPSSQLVTPTDLVLHKGPFDDRIRSYGYESAFHLSSCQRFSDMEDARPFSTPESPFPPGHTIHTSHCLPSPLPSKSSPLQIGSLPNPQIALPSEFISTSDVEESPVVFESVDASRNSTRSDDRIPGDSQRVALTTSFFPARPHQGTSNIKVFDLVWGPDRLAEQLSILMLSLYGSIRQRDCFDWMTGRRSTGTTGLRHFLDTHDHIISWVEQSILAYDDITQQSEALDFWIRVAEKCHALRNFDSSCAIILALSGPPLSSLRSVWTRCSQRQTFSVLRDMLDAANKFRRLMDIMDATKGPSVPFVREYLAHVKELHVERSPGNTPLGSGYAADPAALRRIRLAAVSTLLRHQSSSYGFETKKFIHGFITSELRAFG